ncbi:hypothetical protein ODU73_002516 [Thermoclostridium stercorarium]|uniref:hypothetical protein n=1 Tax=Thermoclostridium stercorarium TaxID=1510 RepID=UPI002248A35D|nr:hypothetical protein [Thermoclostridium stercorarium]UZQ85381.1 hypothetical protein ODU73_002516 [Thermoclostridium stercorarium]
MEQLKSGWDLFLLPRTWHKRLNDSLVSLLPGILLVGFFDVLVYRTRSIFLDFIIGSPAAKAGKALLFILTVAAVGFLDVLCAAWPIADLCRFIARKNNKFIIPGFNIILMKSYAYSHLLFYPVLLIYNPTGLQMEKLLDRNINPATRIIIIVLYVWSLLQIAAQPAILLRTVGIKSKLDFSEKLLVAVVMFIWLNLEGQAIMFIIELAYKLFASLYGMP